MYVAIFGKRFDRRYGGQLALWQDHYCCSKKGKLVVFTGVQEAREPVY